MEYISDYLILIECPSCGHEHYWGIGEPNKEHCPYCEFCSAPLTGKLAHQTNPPKYSPDTE